MMEISVITVNRNNAAGLLKTIDSVIEQTTPPFEFIVIDGASTDESVKIIHDHVDYISYWVSEPDGGIYNAMNKGIRNAHGEWCIFLNSGDAFSSATVLEQLQNSGADSDIISGHTIAMSDPPLNVYAPPTITLAFFFNNSLNHQSAFIRRQLLLKHPYDESFKIVADRKFFLQALIFDDCSYQVVDIAVANYDTTGISARLPVVTDQENTRLLEEMFPYRIRQDYCQRFADGLFGDTPYVRLFAEIGRRRWRQLVYCLVRGLLICLSPFIKQARFVRDY